MKRKVEEVQSESKSSRLVKRRRTGGKIHLFDLSDELLLRSISFLNVGDLVKCDRVCRKLRRLSTDNEIWREKYYNQFVRQRARRLPALQSMSTQEQENSALLYSSRQAKWLEHSHLVGIHAATDWKHAYTIRYNWHQGRARRSEVQVDSRPRPVALAKTCRGRLYTVDSTHGLRVWKKGRVTHTCAISQQSVPSALAVDGNDTIVRMCVGHENGTLSVYGFDGNNLSFDFESAHTKGSVLESLAMTWPYVLTLSASRNMTLLCRSDDAEETEVKCLASLYSDTPLTPAALSLRNTGTTLTAGICYAFNRFNAGWCLGLQEIRMDLQGVVKKNRTTTSLASSSRQTSPSMLFTSRSASTSAFGLHPELMRSPNSLSYCGCYILAGLPDNTLMVYTVTSTDNKLEINTGRRLWGHTSAISAAEVTSTGKAVSISSVSEEMRYWELEEVLTSSSLKKTSTPIKSTDLGLLTEAITLRGSGLGLALKDVRREDQLYRRCVSFDDEQAIVVGERGEKQIISCFDFA